MLRAALFEWEALGNHHPVQLLPETKITLKSPINIYKL